MDLDPTTTKYEITAEMNAEGVVEKPDVIGAIFGQTEGLLGDELDLRDLQKSGRIGRIEVTADSKKGKTTGTITLPSSLDKVETAILAAALESIDRIGPCKATVEVTSIEDVRVSKRDQVMARAKELLLDIADESKDSSGAIIDEVKESVRIEELVSYGAERLPAGPNVSSSDSIIVVEGRNDVANLLKNGIKNAIATEGTSIPKTIIDLSKEKVVTAFVDGDRGGELLLKELLQVAQVDFVAQAPRAREVEEITHKSMTKCLRNKLPAEQYMQESGIKSEAAQETQQKEEPKKERPKKERSRGGRSEQDRGGRGRQKPRQRGQQKTEESKERKDRGGRQKSQQKTEERKDRGGEPSRPKRETPDLSAYAKHLDDLSGQLQGVLLDTGGSIVKGPIPVRDLADTLKKEGGKVQAVVFDGVITQRILDIAVEKDIQVLVGVKKGNITNEPDQVEVLTKAEL